MHIVVAQQQCALAEIVERAGRQDQPQPTDHDRTAPEMAHIGVQRLSPGDREHNRRQREEGDVEVTADEAERIRR